MQRVAVLALDGSLHFELAVPGQVFGTANQVAQRRLYDVRICHPRGRDSIETAAEFGGAQVTTPWQPKFLAAADIVVIPGDERAIGRALARPSEEVLDVLRDAVDRNARLVSLCVGAFTLAAGGHLDGRRATTHWAYARDLASRYPSVEVSADALYIDGGDVLTSAGVTSSIDLCIHIVRSDHGDSVASETARHLVMPPHRLGGQSQFVQRETLLAGSGSLSDTLSWLETQLEKSLSLSDIARYAGTSERSLTRQFRLQTGVPPIRWLLNARIERAKTLLADTNLTIEEVARRSGFGSGATFRHHFLRIACVPPSQYRQTFRKAGAGSPPTQ